MGWAKLREREKRKEEGEENVKKRRKGERRKCEKKKRREKKRENMGLNFQPEKGYKTKHGTAKRRNRIRMKEKLNEERGNRMKERKPNEREETE